MRRAVIAMVALAACKNKPHVDLEFDLDLRSHTCATYPRDRALAREVEQISERVTEKGADSPEVFARDGALVVRLPAETSAMLRDDIAALVTRTAKLELRLVDDSSLEMAQLASHAAGGDVQAMVDQGPRRHAVVLSAADRDGALPVDEARHFGCEFSDDRVEDGKVHCVVKGYRLIEDRVAEITASDPALALPPDRELVYGYQNDARAWRSYLAHREVVLDGTAIEKVRATYDTARAFPIVDAELTATGAKGLAALSAQHAGERIAILLDGRVKAAPMIPAVFEGTHWRIATDGSDLDERERERDDLAVVLRVGSLPCGLRRVR